MAIFASCHSVSNHVMCTQGLFLCQSFFFSTIGLVVGRNRCQLPLRCRAWALTQDFAITWLAHPSHPTESSLRFGFIVEPFHYGLAVRFQLLSTVGFAAAVSFYYRTVDSDLTRTFTSLR